MTVDLDSSQADVLKTLARLQGNGSHLVYEQICVGKTAGTTYNTLLRLRDHGLVETIPWCDAYDQWHTGWGVTGDGNDWLRRQPEESDEPDDSAPDDPFERHGVSRT